MTTIHLFYYCEKVFILWIYGWLGKSQWNTLHEKEDFCSHLKMEDNTDADYAHTKRVCKGKHHDLYLQSEIILLADVFKNFRNTCLKIYELDPGKFLSAPGLAWK